MIKLVSLIVFAYLIGSIPTAYIAGKIKKGIDIRKEGTGNIGATNALLVVGPLFGVLVYIIDVLKGLIPVIIARDMFGSDISMALTGLAAILGHDFSIFLGFSGGKGIATTTGVIIGINLNLMLYILLAWFILMVLSNYFIVASLLSTVLVPVLMYYWGLSYTFILFGIIYMLIAMYTHRQDFVRILWGREKKAMASIRKMINKEKII